MDKNQAAVALFDKLADVYQQKYMNVDLYGETLDLFCDNIPKQNAHILELACGPGNITKYLLAKRPDFEILGTDLAQNMIALAVANNPEAKFQLMDCRAIANISTQYDGIMCGFCLPYLTKEEAIQLIADAGKILCEGGMLYISTMEDDYSKSGLQTASTGDQLYMYYHQADYLTRALIENGFTIIHIRHQDYPTTNETKVTDLVLIARR